MKLVAWALAVVLIPAALRAQAFPHARHAGVFPTCMTCHEGIATGDAARAFPSPAACRACHDGTVQPVVQWTPTARGVGLIAFSHPTHLARAKDVVCMSCHAVANPNEWMNVARPAPERCLSCHQHTASAHLAADNVCATCHRPLTKAVGFTDARVAALPKPPSHIRADFVSAHGDMARANAPNCSMCHARESCQRCHVNGATAPLIQALDKDARVARLTVGKAPSYPKPADHASAQFGLIHGTGARANTARCASCHTRASCQTCHIGDGARDVLQRMPDARAATAPGVQLRQVTRIDPMAKSLAAAVTAAPVVAQVPRADTTTHRVSVHPTGFARTHSTIAASGEIQCASCHAQRFCADCHRGERTTRRYHPANFVSIHAPQAYGRDNQCTACHSTEAFCRDCHRQAGLAARTNVRSTVFHSAQPLWLLQHGRVARQDLPSCTTCHQQTYCMQCQDYRHVSLRTVPSCPSLSQAAKA